MKVIRIKNILFIVFLFLHFSEATANDSINDNDMAKRVTAELKAIRSLDMPTVSEISELILQEKFLSFEALSKKYEKEFQQDPRYESPLTKLYEAIDGNNLQILPKLDKWVESRPSYISYSARGIYKMSRGYKIRGENSVSETPKINILKMEAIHGEAKHDLLIAIKTNNRFPPAYIGLINVERASGNGDDCKRIAIDANRLIPESYYIRFAYLQTLEPRWGGSYSAMLAYTNNIDAALTKLNPRIWGLKAEVPAERGFTAWLDNDYTQAIKYYSEALRYGDRMEFLKNRGKIYMSSGQYELALNDFSRYLNFDKSNEEVNRYIVQVRDYLASINEKK